MLQLTTPRSSIDLTSLQGIPLDQIGIKEIPVNIVIGTPTSPDLFAIFNKSTIDELLAVPGCVGIRFYPGIKDDKLVLIATCVDDLYNDMNEINNGKCACGYSNLAVESHETMVPESRNWILAKGHPETPNLSNLKIIQKVKTPLGTSENFKAYFDKVFFNNNFGSANRVRFDVAELKFFGDGETKRTIAATFLDVPSTTTSASLLPCPPNCGGDYTTDEIA
ncbi:MAG: hypothetical protein AB8H03_19865 [Saprospiraceae bacterium]